MSDKERLKSCFLDDQKIFGISVNDEESVEVLRRWKPFQENKESLVHAQRVDELLKRRALEEALWKKK